MSKLSELLRHAMVSGYRVTFQPVSYDRDRVEVVVEYPSESYQAASQEIDAQELALATEEEAEEFLTAVLYCWIGTAVIKASTR